MKKLFTLGNIFPLIFVIFTISCSKSDPGPAPPGGGNPPVLPTPSFTIIKKDTAWYQGTASVTFSLKDATILTINGIPYPVTSTSYSVNNVTNPVDLKFKYTGNGKTDSSIVTLSAYSDTTTRIAYAAPDKTGIWTMYKRRVLWPNGQWTTETGTCEPSKFFPNGLSIWYHDMCTPGAQNGTGTPWRIENQTITLYGKTFLLLQLSSTNYIRATLPVPGGDPNYYEEYFVKN